MQDDQKRTHGSSINYSHFLLTNYGRYDIKLYIQLLAFRLAPFLASYKAKKGNVEMIEKRTNPPLAQALSDNNIP